jgi:hypothetical protein
MAVAAHPTVVPPMRVALAKHVGQGNLAKHDQLRMENLLAKAGGLKVRAPIATVAENRAVVYTASVGVGSPATQCK